MPNVQRASLGATCAVLLAATPAVADVTAEQVWESVQKSLSAYPSDVLTFGEPVTGDGSLTIPDLAINASGPEGTVQSDVGDLVLTELGDGTVDVTTPSEINVVFSPEGEIVDDQRATVGLRTDGLSMIVSGTPEAMTYTYSADSYEVALDELVVDGAPVEGVARLVIDAIAGAYTLLEGTPRAVESAGGAQRVEALVDFDTPEDQTALFFSAQIEDIAFDSETAIPDSMTGDAAPAEMANAFQDGFRISVDSSIGGAAMMLNFTDPTTSASGTLSVAGSQTALSLDADAVSYNSQVSGLAVTAQGSDIPVPVEISADGYGVTLEMPLSSTDGPSDLAARIAIENLAISDMLWMMVDQAGELPRDPLTLILELSGTGRLLFDLTDPAQFGQIAGADMPGELYSLNLDELTMRAAGAELTGGGSFTFDNSDTTTFPGAPRPEGELGLKLVGGNGLLDSLVALGLIPEQAAMQGRMMIGMFADVTGDDQLETTVEVNEQGHVIVNGQRIQ